MKDSVFGIIGVTMLVTTAITGCSTSATQSTHVTHTVVKTHRAIAPLTKTDVTKELEGQTSANVFHDIHMITLKNVGTRAYSLLSFQENGQLKYAVVFRSPSQGTGMGIVSVTHVKGQPLEAGQLVGKDGYNFVAGVVVQDPSVKRVVLTFTNGSVKQAPIRNGYFWFFGKVGTSQSDAYLQGMMGVTDHGQIVVNAAPGFS
ncbi:hypothetical protein [Alicyclobacillus sp. SP_1]|uniref:hypothetical protein n=1 Tax=Alicyclobacillus sp. SP_1 TaxID=2942475 RepID=UPI002157EB4D|nr:hypothetical protein [Alicyclobacillus sp. SP_1]